ncbi:hypothetical protein DL769_011126 [Monosporascus sp. CRB-8-3]|nr:hypothetical protein DL769_011126 [Monosporascus sp. CRB-8-3]
MVDEIIQRPGKDFILAYPFSGHSVADGPPSSYEDLRLSHTIPAPRSNTVISAQLMPNLSRSARTSRTLPSISLYTRAISRILLSFSPIAVAIAVFLPPTRPPSSSPSPPSPPAETETP